MEKILPPINAISQPYWDGCQQGVLRVQRCITCGHLQLYPRIFCTQCAGEDLDWIDVSGKGIIASFTVVTRGISKAYSAPYVVSLIDLDEGPRMMSSIVHSDGTGLEVGMSVEVAFEPWSKTIMMPVFKLL